jgi:hypothetical protein
VEFLVADANMRRTNRGPAPNSRVVRMGGTRVGRGLGEGVALGNSDSGICGGGGRFPVSRFGVGSDGPEGRCDSNGNDCCIGVG